MVFKKPASGTGGKAGQRDSGLVEYRRQIDAIDDAIMEQLAERFEIVRKVGELKSSEIADGRKSIIRPGREASMIRRVIAKTPDYVPKAMLAQLWRLIISTAISIEEDTSISVLATLENKECYWLTREYFGGCTEISQRPTPSEVLQDVVSGRSSIGVLPLWDESSQFPWWAKLLQDDEQPKIFARLPFIQTQPSQKSPLVAIGYVTPESSGDDTSLWVIGVSERIADHDVESALEKSGMTYTSQGHARLMGSPNLRCYLVAFNEYMEAADIRIKRLLKAILPNPQPSMHVEAHYLGSFANPIAFWNSEQQ